MEKPFDAAFSNAALHWCKRDPAGVLARLKQVLKPGGRFVCEMGGFMNCVGEEHPPVAFHGKYLGDRRRQDRVTPRREGTWAQSGGDGPLVFPNRRRIPSRELTRTY